jgi:hypothetical protein
MDSVSSRDIKLYNGYSISNRNQSQTSEPKNTKYKNNSYLKNVRVGGETLQPSLRFNDGKIDMLQIF